MKFNIQCDNCKWTYEIKDGYNNESRIKLSIIGDQLVEVTCGICGESVVTVDGDIL